MKNNEDIEHFDESFWAFIYLLVEYPEKYLNTRGMTIYNIAADGGKCKSIEKMSSHLNKTREHASGLCNALRKEKHLDFVREANKHAIVFHKYILKETGQWIKVITK